MSSKFFGKIISAAVSTALLFSTVSFTTFAADQQMRGNINGYDYEMWNQNSAGIITFQPDTSSFICSWHDIEYFVASLGKNYDSSKKNYRAISNLAFYYELEFTPHGNAFFGAYGWTRNPLVEYFIVDGWGDCRPSGETNTVNLGTAIVNDHEYDVFKCYRYNQPNLDGTSTYPQYWSVRKTSASLNDTTNYISDRIDISKHFDSWKNLGLNTTGTLYSAVFYIEGRNSSGSAKLKSLVFGGGFDGKKVRVRGLGEYEEMILPCDDDGYYIRYDFDKEIGNWEFNGYEHVIYDAEGYNGTNGMLVSNRTSGWQSPRTYLSTGTFIPGETYSIGMMVKQEEEPTGDMWLELEYITPDGELTYLPVVKATAAKGEWTDLSNACFTLDIPKGSKELRLFVETVPGCEDIYIDDFYVGVSGAKPLSQLNTDPVSDLIGDINCDGVIDVYDLAHLRKGILNMITGTAKAPANSDINGDGDVNVADLVLLQRYLLGAEKLPVTIKTSTSTTTTTTSKTTTIISTTTSSTSSSVTSTAAETLSSKTTSLETTTAVETSTTAKIVTEPYEFNSQYLFVPTRKYLPNEVYPQTKLITSKYDFDSFVTEKDKDYYMLYDRNNDYSMAFPKATKNYTDEWFKTHNLLMIFLQEGFQARDTYMLSYVKSDEIGIQRLQKGGDDALAQWLILIELDKNAEINDDIKVSITNSPDMTSPFDGF